MIEKQHSVTTFGEKVQAKWAKLSEGDVRDIGKDLNVLANKISTVYGRSKETVKKEVSDFQKSIPK